MEAWQYIALLGAVIAVAAFILPKGTQVKTDRVQHGDSTEHIELAFEQFMENMENDHRDLVQMLTSSLQTLREENRQQAEKLTNMEKKYSALEERISSLSHALTATTTKLEMLQKGGTFAINDHQSAVYSSQEPSQPETDTYATTLVNDSTSIHYRYAQVFEMYNSGKSIEAIAKKLGKNKGEVQLILQLAKQEEHIRNA